MKKVLVPIDFTAVSMNALSFAVRLFPDAEIHCLHISSGSLQTNQPLTLKYNQGIVTSREETLSTTIDEHMQSLDFQGKI